MNSDDEAYNKFIVTSDEEEKENVSDKQPKTSREQFSLMSKFTQELNEQSMTKEERDQRWASLAEELNQIGPPRRNHFEWRRVWSVFKYNQKRKQPVTEAIGKRRSCQERLEEPVFVHPLVGQVSVVTSDGQPSTSVQILADKLDEIINVLKVIAENTSH